MLSFLRLLHYQIPNLPRANITSKIIICTIREQITVRFMACDSVTNNTAHTLFNFGKRFGTNYERAIFNFMRLIQEQIFTVENV